MQTSIRLWKETYKRIISCTHNIHMSWSMAGSCAGPPGADIWSSSHCCWQSFRFQQIMWGKKRVNVYNLRDLSNRSHQFSLNLMTLAFTASAYFSSYLIFCAYLSETYLVLPLYVICPHLPDVCLTLIVVPLLRYPQTEDLIDAFVLTFMASVIL